ncbi:hypothetical protein DFA_04581 [Cavenderia fasciculata]|uniref:KH type-2 domain-containing protein n=1 Tax=Cavenderia fasciculata TaxID=261658 RepID=F4PPZ2_CACFS|nr:uncharacterized protein DFA_04581 [Cavenderia fasciculata]EGG22455.1 hypothetical protein DFA_04581 [Cavenderia fasciculata]|eukprot:XP_004360306.1 hypothetical protein DFA_04581 [Cavenderia fasciculata]
MISSITSKCCLESSFKSICKTLIQTNIITTHSTNLFSYRKDNTSNDLYIKRDYALIHRYEPKTLDPKKKELEDLKQKIVKQKEEDLITSPRQYQRVVRNYNITPPSIYEMETMTKEPKKVEGSKRLNVAVIGAPNAGKSSLVNTIIGEKICAVSSREHTTRDNIIGILTEDKTQLVFHDTPGIIKHFEMKGKIREFVNMAWSVVKEADVVLLVVDAGAHQSEFSPTVGSASSALTTTDTSHIVTLLESQMLDLLKEMKMIQQQQDDIDRVKEFILVLNKVDLIVRKEDLLRLISRLNEGSIFSDTFIISATNNIHVGDLKGSLLARAVEGDWEFDDESKTDQTEIFRASEIIKEKVYERMRQEIPYAVQQAMVGWTNFSNGDLRIDHDLIVQKDSHKSAILGAGGRTIKSIYLEAKKDLEKVFNRRVHLFLTVKVKKNIPLDDD